MRQTQPAQFITHLPLKFQIPGVSPLAYIGNDSRRTVSGGWFVVASRFRLGGKKEAAGAAVAVILAGIMDIE
jgi:hypothetical protein